jgi:hypothetical protein
MEHMLTCLLIHLFGNDSCVSNNVEPCHRRSKVMGILLLVIVMLLIIASVVSGFAGLFLPILLLVGLAVLAIYWRKSWY